MVCQPTVGGAAVHVRGLAQAAIRAGYDVHAVVPAEGDLAGWLSAAGVNVTAARLKRSLDWRDVGYVWTLRRIFKTADIVHLHSSKAGMLGRLALFSLGAQRPPSLFTPHGWSWLVGGRAAWLYRFLERLLKCVCDAIIAVSDADAEEGRRNLAGAPIAVFPNGVDVEHFAPDGPCLRGRYSYCVLVVGRLTRAKGQDLALRAAARAPRDIEWRFVGSGDDAAELEQLRTELDLSNATLIGEDDPAPHYRAADLVLVPSRWDACSLVVLEALACGTAVLASENVGVASSFPQGVHHLKVLEPVEIAKTVTALLSNTSVLRSNLEETSRCVRDKWNLSTRLSPLINFYSDILVS